MFDPVIRLGVTGLSQAGKTVFITSLVANLLDRRRMPLLRAHAEGRIAAVHLQPQPDDTMPRFAYEDHLAALSGDPAAWPRSTRSVSQLRLSFRTAARGLLAGFGGERRLHLDIVDYPGEWLLDLTLLDADYATWSARVLAAAERPARAGLAKPFLERMKAADPHAPFDEARAMALADVYRGYLRGVRDAGLLADPPGRFLLPGELEGSPVLTFAPMPHNGTPRRGSLTYEMARRYDAYVKRVVKPFFTEHFSRIDRQIVLVDVLSALAQGPAALEDLRLSMSSILHAFRPGRNSWLSLILGRRVDHILFAATKADHLHHSQHARLEAIVAALTEDARNRAGFAGAQTTSVALAGLRATVEDRRKHDGRAVDLVRGIRADGRHIALMGGELPADPKVLLSSARGGQGGWIDGAYASARFMPLPADGKGGLPHIRLDRAAEFLLGDRL